jgi:hypothetical protein
MMPPRRPKNSKPKSTTTTRGRRRAWHIILIDQEPLRRTALAECRKAMARLDKARAEWNRFEHQDQPAFARWMAREFGALLSQGRDLEAQIREKEMLIHEVEMEIRFGGRGPHSAYQHVMYQRANPRRAGDDFDDFGRDGNAPNDSSSDDPADLSEFEKEALFQDWLREFLGVNPDKIGDREYWATFEAFKASVFGARSEAAPNAEPAEDSRPNGQADTERSRLKSLYRRLVRQLHPDLQADGDSTVSALWHEVQEAYAAGNVERLETLLALSELESDKLGAQTTLSQMRAVLKELKTALRNLQRSVRAVLLDDAWDFARRGATAAIQLRIQDELEATVAERRQRLTALNEIIVSWSRPSAPKGRRKAPLVHPRFAF